MDVCKINYAYASHVIVFQSIPLTLCCDRL